ncbi:hypothetical protein TWF569_006697 [Orbilia oligospora]|uniref:Uncharacterized protein n=1 Tax=Orbilia oligospora TaxID=2813651 RepID=A0A7C8NE38_ORBOL|nr:hypothetical protein TWF102_005261 [Orbilia oligospora]KAF3101847.1 hypothetical protein TWF103_007837 [Orbilia oligospora]KAF3101848.1 hypothetical protein TWF103_007837 [Orbilia oligospora]KAF3111727.1 hypothetical protein TWF706_011463 [Orbilia oligospora]KAF3133622.1 hypothetical protein TWF703_006679 [Orbilia oligospora]
MVLLPGYRAAKAQPFQRILFFLGANEVGGHAYLYRMLQKTQHPLYIIYATRRPTDGQLPFNVLLRSEEFQKRLAETKSSMLFYQSPWKYTELGSDDDWVTRARKPIIRCSSAHGERPISYIFINGHEHYGMQQNPEENNMARMLRLQKYWAPYQGALTTIARPDKNNIYDHQITYVTTKFFVTHMSATINALLPMVRDDGEGVVVLKTPRSGKLEIVGSRQLRADFVNPTPRFYESAVQEVRKVSDSLTKTRKLREPPWPHKRNWLRLGDIFAKSLITMYQSFTPFQNITFRRCAHDYDDIDGPASLLMDPNIRIANSGFDQEDLDSLTLDFFEDVEAAPPITGGLIRRTASPLVLPHNQGRGNRKDWMTKKLLGGPGDRKPLVRSVTPTLSIDEGGGPSRYNPFDQRYKPYLAHPKGEKPPSVSKKRPPSAPKFDT